MPAPRAPSNVLRRLVLLRRPTEMLLVSARGKDIVFRTAIWISCNRVVEIATPTERWHRFASQLSG